jgi:dynactin 1
MKDELVERATQIRLRDKTLEESNVKIELLESRMRNVTKQSERIEELERLVSEGAAREKDFSEAIETLNEEIQALEIDVAKWRKAAEDRRAVGETDRAGQERAVATAREVGALKKEIEALKGAVGFFRRENERLRKEDVDAPQAWLKKPLKDPKVAQARELEGKMEKEAKDVLEELRRMVVEEKVLELKADTQRLGWRPVRETPRWIVARQRERYEAVKAWKKDLVRRVEDAVESEKKKKSEEEEEEEEEQPKERKVAATLRVHSRPPRKHNWASGEVVVQEPENWEALRGRLGVVDV